MSTDTKKDKNGINTTRHNFDFFVKQRVITLFVIGSIMGTVLNMLQMEYKANLFPSNFYLFLQTTWWVIPFCGLTGVYMGLFYPFIDHKFGKCHQNANEPTNAIRCVAIFLGLNHLCAKITFPNSFHFLASLMVFCIVFWYWFDNSKHGLILSMANSFLVIVGAHFLRYMDLIRYTEIQFNYLQICLLCLIFSGGITFGNIGRLLVSVTHHPKTEDISHPHIE